MWHHYIRHEISCVPKFVKVVLHTREAILNKSETIEQRFWNQVARMDAVRVKITAKRWSCPYSWLIKHYAVKAYGGVAV
jgi:hypothetical protein